MTHIRKSFGQRENLFQLAIPVAHNQSITVVDNAWIQGDHAGDFLFVAQGFEGFEPFNTVVNLVWIQEGIDR